MAQWTTRDIPSQSGRMAIVTGATGGLGFETALGLAQAGAEVVLTGRNEGKGLRAIERISTIYPESRVAFEILDMADLNSIAIFAKSYLRVERPIDLLVNNAGVMAVPTRQTTADGFELQFGTNYLGHFALTAQLLPLLRGGRKARVVNISSIAHKHGAIHFDDLQAERRYVPWETYSQSKLAMLMFAFELQRKSDENGWGLMSNAAHPGWSRTDLIVNGPGKNSWQARMGGLVAPLMSQSAAQGALPILFAATSPEAKDGGYYGPKGFFELKGPVGPAHVARQAKDVNAQRKLWEISEQLTGVSA